MSSTQEHWLMKEKDYSRKDRLGIENRKIVEFFRGEGSKDPHGPFQHLGQQTQEFFLYIKSKRYLVEVRIPRGYPYQEPRVILPEYIVGRHQDGMRHVLIYDGMEVLCIFPEEAVWSQHYTVALIMYQTKLWLKQCSDDLTER